MRHVGHSPAMCPGLQSGLERLQTRWRLLQSRVLAAPNPKLPPSLARCLWGAALLAIKEG